LDHSGESKVSASAEIDPRDAPQRTKQIVLNVNGINHSLEIESRTTLAEALRENLGLTGTKIGCNRAECGSCTVIIDGDAVYSCTTLAASAAGKKIETIEGISEGSELHPIQELFIQYDALQCGYCIPGIIMSMKAMLDRHHGKLSRDEIRQGISGNYCRCGAYPNIEKVAMILSEGSSEKK
jgi:aerobic-type carbon monoxide dehydrogenase small subunit (CoxS/CutS family)